jgi:hypothetical protein
LLPDRERRKDREAQGHLDPGRPLNWGRTGYGVPTPKGKIDGATERGVYS